MKILFTGGSSFTGYWFIRELSAAGHEVVSVFRKPLSAYDGVRGKRVAALSEHCEAVAECEFGDDRFLDLVAQNGPWDILCHHAADVTDYKSEDFDVVGALSNNVRNLGVVLSRLRDNGCDKIALTGSVFEQEEGAGSGAMDAFSPYGLSKGLTYDVFRYYAMRHGLHLGKFVIPNPFGPFEEPRFTSYLVRCWYKQEVASVNTPAYVRDNIHVSLLAKSYVRFIEQLPSKSPGLSALHPSGYPEGQGAFALRFAAALRERLGLACDVDLHEQTSFDEPRVRINTDIPDYEALGWVESEAWDALAEYYREAFGA